ncbi:DUF5688 family protein [Butyrivibrio sp. VCD2006]|uniref:DUF5688 family protein n=1 Tax=Butyrivibrio sp. VCD2006 TaxID=1280664 RepID=UPI00040DA0C9|nr:DUF5688 family protein [Butyrivibrio sp. VCD2006]
MVRKEKFYNEVMERAKEYYKDRARVSMHEVTKNNGLKKTGFCVTMIGGNCGPTLYLDEYYKEFENGKVFDSVFNDIIKMMDAHLVPEKMDVTFFTDFDRIYDKICFRLVNAKENEEKLKECPHRLLEDLAVVYYISMTSLGIEGSVAIKNELMEVWKATEEDLYEAAMDNTPRLYPAEIITMAEFLKRRTGHSFFPNEATSNGFLIGSNDRYTNGATILLYPGLLKEVGDFFQDNFYIIPSSIHEILFMKELFYGDEPGTLEDMIRNVNLTCVLPEDVLSNSLYYYDRAAENNIKKVEQVRDTMLL